MEVEGPRPVREILAEMKAGKIEALRELLEHPVAVTRRIPRALLREERVESMHEEILSALGAGDPDLGEWVLEKLIKRRRRIMKPLPLYVRKWESPREVIKKEVSRHPAAAVGKILRLIHPETQAYLLFQDIKRKISEVVRSRDAAPATQRRQISSVHPHLRSVSRLISAISRDDYRAKNNYDGVLNRVDELRLLLNENISEPQARRILKKLDELSQEFEELRKRSMDARVKEVREILERLKSEK